MIQRREFLKVSGAGLSLFALSPSGCGVGPLSEFGGVDAALTVGEAHLTYDQRGQSYELHAARHRVVMRDAEGSVVWELGGLGSDHGRFNYPVALAPHAHGQVAIVDLGNGRVEVFDAEGRYLFSLGRDLGAGKLRAPRAVAVSSAREYYVCDALAHRVQVFDQSGRFLRSIGGFGLGPLGLNGPVAAAFDSASALHVLDRGNARVQVFGTEGQHLRSYGAYGFGRGQLQLPSTLVIGDDGTSYVGDVAARRVNAFSPQGHFETAVEPRCADGRPGQLSWMSWVPEIPGLTRGGLYIAATPISARRA